MPNAPSLSRRNFVRLGANKVIAGSTTPPTTSLELPVRLTSDDDHHILKSLKINMVKVEGSLTEKFKAAKLAGFEGIELDSPGFEVEEARKAIAESGLPVDGTVCSTHWSIRHTSPDAGQRAQALADLQKAIRDTDAVGGNTVLLVVGHGNDGPEDEIWPRAIENISKALPLASRLGITIAIENVWNHFLYDHEGDENQSAEKFARFCDDLNSPWVGMQFDIGNHWKYGDCGQWIRTLGKRVVKLDIKGYSRTNDNWAKLGDDDIDWADVRAALSEINFSGWAAAEVGGGGPDRLAEISAAMDTCLGRG
jgi:hexulose-6-phosphate isomerase